MSKILFVIDPQNDFMDSPNFQGSLAVAGAYADMTRLSDFLLKNPIDNVMITMDTHSVEHIAHKNWWINANGENPSPFTIISSTDIADGTWKPVNPERQDWSEFYVHTLEKNGKYPLCIWPFHCIKGTKGFEVEATFAAAVSDWEQATNKKATYITKGHNDFTEHYSGLSAEVPVLKDPTTQLNTKAIAELNQHDEIYVAGEALSHCVAYTTLDLLNNMPVEDRKKVILLVDCMNPVTGFEKAGQDFLAKAQELGATLQTSVVKKRPTP